MDLSEAFKHFCKARLLEGADGSRNLLRDDSDVCSSVFYLLLEAIVTRSREDLSIKDLKVMQAVLNDGVEAFLQFPHELSFEDWTTVLKSIRKCNLGQLKYHIALSLPVFNKIRNMDPKRIVHKAESMNKKCLHLWEAKMMALMKLSNSQPVLVLSSIDDLIEDVVGLLEFFAKASMKSLTEINDAIQRQADHDLLGKFLLLLDTFEKGTDVTGSEFTIGPPARAHQLGGLELGLEYACAPSFGKKIPVSPLFPGLSYTGQPGKIVESQREKQGAESHDIGGSSKQPIHVTHKASSSTGLQASQGEDQAIDDFQTPQNGAEVDSLKAWLSN